MDIASILGNASVAKLKSEVKPHIDRELVLQRRKARRDAKKARRATRSERGCGWNHRVPGAEVLDDLCEPRGTANPAKSDWKDPEWAEVDREIPGVWLNGHYVRNGSKTHNIGAARANECPSIPAGKRRKHLEREWRGMSWNDKVQHGIVVER